MGWSTSSIWVRTPWPSRRPWRSSTRRVGRWRSRRGTRSRAVARTRERDEGYGHWAQAQGSFWSASCGAARKAGGVTSILVQVGRLYSGGPAGRMPALRRAGCPRSGGMPALRHVPLAPLRRFRYPPLTATLDANHPVRHPLGHQQPALLRNCFMRVVARRAPHSAPCRRGGRSTAAPGFRAAVFGSTVRPSRSSRPIPSAQGTPPSLR